MKINSTPISWQAMALVLANCLLGVILYLGIEIRNELAEMRNEVNRIQRNDGVQDQRLETLEAWLWRRSRPANGGASR